MKNLITSCLFICTLSFSFGQNSIGMEMISDSMWIDRTEVTLADYYDFLYQYEGDQTIASLLPDTTKMPSGMGIFFYYFFMEGNDMEMSNIRSPRNNAEIVFGFASRNKEQVKYIIELGAYPITGISYSQAQEYIDWRNRLLQENPEDQYYTCTLASVEELKNSTLIGLDLEKTEVATAFLTTGKNKKGCQLLNFKNDTPCESDLKYKKTSHPSGIMKATSYWPNAMGIWNLQGNVSEMTSEEGVAYGGNYTLPFTECKPESIQKYTQPEPWLGFRCIIVKK